MIAKQCLLPVVAIGVSARFGPLSAGHSGVLSRSDSGGVRWKHRRHARSAS